jgi:hypothetical protein
MTSLEAVLSIKSAAMDGRFWISRRHFAEVRTNSAGASDPGRIAQK